jgi:hypothetical protein
MAQLADNAQFANVSDVPLTEGEQVLSGDAPTCLVSVDRDEPQPPARPVLHNLLSNRQRAQIVVAV